MPLTHSPLRPATLALALLAAHGTTMPVAAQRSATETKTIESYRLTMPVLRKVLPALYAPQRKNCEQNEQRDPQTLSLAELTKTLERCWPVMEKLNEAGVPPSDAALVLASLYSTSHAIARRNGDAQAVPPGALRDNALLLQENDAELAKLTNEEGRS